MGRKRKLPADPFPVQIEALAENGRGLTQHEGRTLEVFDALAGEQVNARYLFGRRFRGQAQMVDVIEPSPERVSPECAYFGTCSACSLQHLSADGQIRHKQASLLACFEQHGLAPARLLSPLQSTQWHYRRKARLSVRKVKGKGRVLVGFRERDSRFVTDMTTCPVLPEAVSRRIPDLCGLIETMDAAEQIPQIEVSCGDEACALVLRHLAPLTDEDTERLRRFGRSQGLIIMTQGGGPDSVRPIEQESAELSYRLEAYGIEYRFGPLDFIQVHAGLNQLMIAQAIELLDLGAGDNVLELFCGLGNFSLPLARHCASVTAIEGDSDLVSRATSNARLNGVENVRFMQADLYQPPVLEGIPDQHFDRVLLDPPRSGAGPVLQAVSDSGAMKVVYVSCNPETLAEDARSLVRQHGFSLVAAGVMDMFPHTAHVESMALFTRE